MPHKENWFVALPFYDVNTDNVFSTEFVVGPCTEEQFEDYLATLLTAEHLLLKVLREFGYTGEHDDLVEVDESKSRPLTMSGFIAGTPSWSAVAELASAPAMNPATGVLTRTTLHDR